jgi:hypothetical protein
MFKLNLIKLRNYVEIIMSTILMFSSIFCFVNAPFVVCVFDECENLSKTNILTIYPRSIAMSCLLSRITMMHKKAHSLKKYEKKIKDYEILYPISRNKNNVRRKTIAAIIAVCAVTIVPINVYRLISINMNYSRNITVYFGLMYTQNMSQCVSELFFCAHCFELFQRFQIINEEMSALKSEIILKNNYPLILKTDKFDHNYIRLSSKSNCSLMIKAYPLVRMIEQLKLRHKCISNAVRKLNNMYDLLLGLSLGALFLMTLSVFYNIFSTSNRTEKHYTFYCFWLFQFGFRFCMIVTTIHITTKEVGKIII